MAPSANLRLDSLGLSQFFSIDDIILRTISGLATVVTTELMPTFAWFGA
jgi:hypothetical protein